MKLELIEIQETYDTEGYLVKRTANDMPVFIPEQMVPTVQIITPDTEWIIQKKFITKEEFNNYQP